MCAPAVTGATDCDRERSRGLAPISRAVETTTYGSRTSAGWTSAGFQARRSETETETEHAAGSDHSAGGRWLDMEAVGVWESPKGGHGSGPGSSCKRGASTAAHGQGRDPETAIATRGTDPVVEMCMSARARSTERLAPTQIRAHVRADSASATRICKLIGACRHLPSPPPPPPHPRRAGVGFWPGWGHGAQCVGSGRACVAQDPDHAPRRRADRASKSPTHTYGLIAFFAPYFGFACGAEAAGLQLFTCALWRKSRRGLQRPKGGRGAARLSEERARRGREIPDGAGRDRWEVVISWKHLQLPHGRVCGVISAGRRSVTVTSRLPDEIWSG